MAKPHYQVRIHEEQKPNLRHPNESAPKTAMGITGPKPTPTATLAARGSWRADTRGNEPELDIRAPEAPAWLEPAAQEHWTKIVGLLVNARIMADAHASALVLLVNSLGRYIEAEKQVSEHGAWFDGGESGIPRVHPCWTVRCKALEHVHKLLCEFGMTPSALSRVHAVPKDKGKADPAKHKPRLVG